MIALIPVPQKQKTKRHLPLNTFLFVATISLFLNITLASAEAYTPEESTNSSCSIIDIACIAEQTLSATEYVVGKITETFKKTPTTEQLAAVENSTGFSSFITDFFSGLFKKTPPEPVLESNKEISPFIQTPPPSFTKEQATTTPTHSEQPQTESQAPILSPQQTVINQPVIERTRETVRTIIQGGVSEDTLAGKLTDLKNELLASIASSVRPTPVSFVGSAQSTPVSMASFALSQKIDKLTNVTLSNTTVSGISGLTDADIPDTITASNYLLSTGGSITGSITLSGTLTVNGTGNSYIAGNVGIGTTTPNNLLQVYDLIDFNNTDSNSKLGYQAGKNIVSGAQYNTFLGYQSGYSSSTASTIAADYNTAIGYQSLFSNTTGKENTANGYRSLYSNTTGFRNTANGYLSLYSNTTGSLNTANGQNALYSNTTGTQNTANGTYVLYTNTTGSSNTASGQNALYSNTTGSYNTAIGSYSLEFNTSGINNTALGLGASDQNTTGSNNTAGGMKALYFNSIGSANTAFGNEAGYGSALSNFASSTILGYRSGYGLTTGSRNILLGYQAGDAITTGQGNIILGYDIDAPSTTNNNQLNIGNLLFGTSLDGTGTTISSGNIGIGTATPGARLSVVSSATSSSAITLYDPLGNASLELRAGTSTLENTFVGVGAGSSVTTGDSNTANGRSALYSNTTGYNNTANGYQSLYSNTTGLRNTANGYNALYNNTTGYSNTANGAYTLINNTTGYYNTANGLEALYSNTTGYSNTANGYDALYSNTTGYDNTANGRSALFSNTTGTSNTANGYRSLSSNTTGSSNTALGYFAGRYLVNGSSSNSTSSNSLYLGYDTRALASGDTNEIVIGYTAIGAGSNSVTLGSTTIATTILQGNVGIGTSTPGAKLNIIGALCVDDTSPTCGNAARTDGTIYAVATAITGIDLAEQYPTKDATLLAGDIVAFDPANEVYVKRASASTAFLGVVSTAPGVLLGGFNEGIYASELKVPIALAGRVPVKVNMEGGPIAVGDAITISSVAGVGTKATVTTQTLGIALQGATSDTTIEVFIKPEYTFVASQFHIDPSTGNVGIGTTTPNHTLSVAGDVGATAFVNTSTKDAKKDIVEANPSEWENALSKIRNLFVAHYRYNTEDENALLRIGLIAEEAPEEVLSPDGKGVDLYKFVTFLAMGMKSLVAKVDALQVSVAALSANTGASLSGVVSEISGTFTSLLTDKLTVGSPSKRTGITLFDEENGAPYCLSISGGSQKVVSGECQTVTPALILAPTTESVIFETNPATSTTNDIVIIDTTTSSSTANIVISSNLTFGSETEILAPEIPIDISDSGTTN